MFLLVYLTAFTKIQRSAAFQHPSARSHAFQFNTRQGQGIMPFTSLAFALSSDVSVLSVKEATEVLTAWDKLYSNQTDSKNELSDSVSREQVRAAIGLLTQEASDLRAQDPIQGRLMLGICASSAQQGIATLKSWVNSLQLPRGLLHGMDDGGVPIEINGGVYIKYNTGGVYTFSDIRKSGMGFDSLWKPGDAMLENYDGIYRGVYYQVELSDKQFRQYFCPLDLFDDIPE
jgi:hypothetical protein